ncbi:MAG: class I SAM-dependent RNA methyltransferase [Planctomycetes bacterium]|nr:class I SAM-dependent RNA methyltransferase [Planctomycetota bacterium]
MGATPLPRVGDEFELAIDALASGGEGVGRADGLVVFVPGAAPGDRARVRVERVEMRFLRARVVELLAASPERRAPRCAHFGDCGGCTWQHVTPAAQHAAKRAFVRDALERIAGVRLERPVELLAGPEWGWRARAELSWRRDERAAAALGYRRAQSHAVVPVRECPVLVPAAEQGLVEASASLARRRDVDPVDVHGRAWLACGDDECVLAGLPGDDAPPGTITQRIAGFSFEFDVDGFFQGNRALVETLVERAVGDAQGALAYDLFAGAGLFTLPLTRRFRHVVGVEGSARAARQLAENARANRIDNLRAEHEDVARWLVRVPRAKPDLVLLDPPRAGAGVELARALVELAPPRIVHVACDPATLARDVKVLLAGGYALRDVVALDLFPQTPHVECIARLDRVG